MLRYDFVEGVPLRGPRPGQAAPEVRHPSTKFENSRFPRQSRGGDARSSDVWWMTRLSWTSMAWRKVFTRFNRG